MICAWGVGDREPSGLGSGTGDVSKLGISDSILVGSAGRGVDEVESSRIGDASGVGDAAGAEVVVAAAGDDELDGVSAGLAELLGLGAGMAVVLCPPAAPVLLCLSLCPGRGMGTTPRPPVGFAAAGSEAVRLPVGAGDGAGDGCSTPRRSPTASKSPDMMAGMCES